ncbi:uncharacterized protein LOC113560573 [Rhopalosiphum maidis]|uniref:uncharacterized protein LOC113560573 n=1 Tax=Rhopalosiphum maidis TaxID=43146 RepID=UPI000EFF0200|nr:uncharacterized protein LOC113560573 [Rhopalosiphum maidis]
MVFYELGLVSEESDTPWTAVQVARISTRHFLHRRHAADIAALAINQDFDSLKPASYSPPKPPQQQIAAKKERTETQLARNFLFQQLKEKKKARELTASQHYKLAKHPQLTSNPKGRKPLENLLLN